MAIRNPNLDEEIIGYDTLQSNEINSLIESGSNENGSWTKFPDGTLICTHGLVIGAQHSQEWGSLNYLPAPTWNFPMPFVSFPAISGSNRNINGFFSSTNTLEGNVVEPRWVCVTPGNFSKSSLRLVAVGRWKE